MGTIHTMDNIELYELVRTPIRAGVSYKRYFRHNEEKNSLKVGQQTVVVDTETRWKLFLFENLNRPSEEMFEQKVF